MLAKNAPSGAPLVIACLCTTLSKICVNVAHVESVTLFDAP